MQTLNNTITSTEVELNEGLFIIELEERLETVEFNYAATNCICRDAPPAGEEV
jgi:hypothetical protein